MQLKCENCGKRHPALAPVWGAHHGQYRVSIYVCGGAPDVNGCGSLGVEVYDQEEDETYLFGALGTVDSVPFLGD